ncbi:hypothetical protein G9A89_020043 [Geosiphon pyriformis]|nr:hypothetical protein G9A89_020043 [Geosiphon pyriformis]
MEEEPVDMRPFISLVKRVMRAFFQTQYIVVMDELIKHQTINDEELSKSIGLTVKEIHKICGTLKEQKMVKTFQRMEPKKAEQRPVPKTYYFIDWLQLVNGVKWKIYKIRVMVSEKMRNEQQNKGFLCPTVGCHKTFSPLDVLNLVDHTRGIFVCDVCNAELSHNDNAENVKGSEKLHGRFMEQSQPIIDLLKDIDKLKIPATTIDKIGGSSTNKVASQAEQDKELEYAKDSGMPADIVVVFLDDNEAAKKAREAETEKKRLQNALPVWHVRSTVSGEAAVEETSRNASSRHVKEEHNEIELDRSNEKNNERQNYYEDYYAKYQQQTGSSTPSNYTNPKEEIEDDEFRPVDFEENGQTDHVNGKEEEYTSAMDEDDEFEPVSVHGNGNYYDDDEFEAVEFDDDQRESKRSRTGSIDDSEGYDTEYGNQTPLVSVNGKMLALNDIKTIHTSLMSPEEQDAYEELRRQHR